MTARRGRNTVVGMQILFLSLLLLVDESDVHLVPVALVQVQLIRPEQLPRRRLLLAGRSARLAVRSGVGCVTHPALPALQPERWLQLPDLRMIRPPVLLQAPMPTVRRLGCRMARVRSRTT